MTAVSAASKPSMFTCSRCGGTPEHKVDVRRISNGALIEWWICGECYDSFRSMIIEKNAEETADGFAYRAPSIKRHALVAARVYVEEAANATALNTDGVRNIGADRVLELIDAALGEQGEASWRRPSA